MSTPKENSIAEEDPTGGKSQAKPSFRPLLMAMGCGFLVSRTFKSYLMPHGPPVLSERIDYIDVDYSNTLLQLSHGKTQKIYEKRQTVDGKEAKPLLKGPETLVFDNDGVMYALSHEGNLLSFSNITKRVPPPTQEDTTGGSAVEEDDSSSFEATVSFVKDLGVGRPLGGKFDQKGTLYIADAILGLTRIQNPSTDPHSKVELVASSVKLANGEFSPILYADDVCIGPKTGRVYFTDATDIAPDRIQTRQGRVWDTMFAYKLDMMRGARRGRILMYDPETDATQILVDHVAFANGIAVDKEESFLIVAQTSSLNILKHYLSGEKAGETEVIVRNLIGYPDGIECSWSSGKCYAAIPSPIVPVHKVFNALPKGFSVLLRALLMSLPRFLSPPAISYGGFLEFDPVLGGVSREYVQDPTGKDIRLVTGVTEYDGKLYLGSLENDYIGVYSL